MTATESDQEQVGLDLSSELRLPALRVQQNANRHLFTFAVDGKRLPDFTTISRVSRGATSSIEGYQRPEVIRHIDAIRQYIESEDAIVPNALVIASMTVSPSSQIQTLRMLVIRHLGQSSSRLIQRPLNLTGLAGSWMGSSERRRSGMLGSSRSRSAWSPSWHKAMQNNELSSFGQRNKAALKEFDLRTPSQRPRANCPSNSCGDNCRAVSWSDSTTTRTLHSLE